MENLEHAMEIYESIKNGDEVTKDIAQLYFAILVLGNKLSKESKENWQLTL
jgi:hypothetical protein